MGLRGGQIIVSFRPQVTSAMMLLLTLFSVLGHGIAGSAMLVGPHVAHELLALLRAHPIPTCKRRKDSSEEHLQTHDFDHLGICLRRISRQPCFAKEYLSNPFAKANAARSCGTFKLGKFLVRHLRACGHGAELAAIVLAGINDDFCHSWLLFMRFHQSALERSGKCKLLNPNKAL